MTDDPTNPDRSREPAGRTFTVSEPYLATRRRMSLAVLALIIVVPGLAVAFGPGGLARFVAMVSRLAAIDLAVLAVSVLLVSYTSRQLHRMRLVVGPAGFAREAGHARDSVAWDDVIAVRVRHDEDSVPTDIEVLRAAGRPVHLYGFEGMADLASDLQTRIPRSASFVSAPQRALASANPAAGVGVLVTMMFGIFVLNEVLGPGAMNRATGVVNLAVGVWLIVYRPVARSDPGRGFIDFGVGLLLLVGAWHALGNWPH